MRIREEKYTRLKGYPTTDNPVPFTSSAKG